MVDGNSRYYRHDGGFDNVGRIQTSAHTYLKHNGVTIVPFKIKERKRGYFSNSVGLSSIDSDMGFIISTSSASSESDIGSPFICIRSLKVTIYGDV